MTDFEKFSDKELYDYCKQVGFNARVWTRKFIAALPEVAKRRLYKKYGYCSIHEFAAKMAGVSHKNVDEVLRIDEKFKEMPKMKELIGEIGLSKLKVVACIATKDMDSFWAEKVKKMTKQVLEVYVREIKTKKFPGELSEENLKFHQQKEQIGLFDSKKSISQEEDVSTTERVKNKKTFTIQIEDEVEFELRKFKQILEKEKKEPIDWNTALKEMAKRALKDEGFKQKQARVSKQKVNVSRYIPAGKRYDLEQKYRGHCAYKGCNKPAEQIHHKNGFAALRSHENLIPLCKNHHDFIHQTNGNPANYLFNRFKTEKFIASH
jgi:hypothetical protein